MPKSEDPDRGGGLSECLSLKAQRGGSALSECLSLKAQRGGGSLRMPKSEGPERGGGLSECLSLKTLSRKTGSFIVLKQLGSMRKVRILLRRGFLRLPKSESQRGRQTGLFIIFEQ